MTSSLVVCVCVACVGDIKADLQSASAVHMASASGARSEASITPRQPAGSELVDCFDEPTPWDTYDPGDDNVGNDPDGYNYPIFDGRYVYFVPQFNGADEHGEILQYDTNGRFEDQSSWKTFDAAGDKMTATRTGYIGGVFDGQYVYFSPFRSGDVTLPPHGDVLRYNTFQPFEDPESWDSYDYGADSAVCDPSCPEADNYGGAVYDGQYVYFVPSNIGLQLNSLVLQYDTAGVFGDHTSWAMYDYGADKNGCVPDADCDPALLGGYVNATLANGFIYFPPSGSSHVLRYNTNGAFTSASSWEAFNPGGNPIGYGGSGFDGRYVYFAPNSDADDGPHGRILRYDTQSTFNEPDSWDAFDFEDICGKRCDPEGYEGVVFDTRYVYFIPSANGTSDHGLVLRYDTQGTFAEHEYWSAYDYSSDPEGDSNARGYRGAVFDGQYIYFAPTRNGTHHGNVLRYDTFGCQAIPTASTWGILILLSLTLVTGICLIRKRVAT